MLGHRSSSPCAPCSANCLHRSWEAGAAELPVYLTPRVGGEGWIPLAAPSSGPPTVTLADGDAEERAAGGVAEAHRGPVHPSDAFTKRPGQAATVLPRSSRRQISSN